MCWKAAGTVNRRHRIATICGLLLLGLLCTSTVLAQNSDDDPAAIGEMLDRLAPPPISDPPTLVESGHYEYYLYCMVCHGDRGQGLTEEWRNAGDPADANCWQSRCHASNYPPGGFELPRYAPPLIGDYTLARFATIGDLHDYIQLSMPWHMPGALEDEQYRRIAIYLADANGIEGLNLGADWAEIAAGLPTSRTIAPPPVATATTASVAPASVAPASVAPASVAPASVVAAEAPGPTWPVLLIAGGVVLVGGAIWANRRKR